MAQFRCTKCDDDISDSYEEGDHTTGIVGGWYCEKCDTGYAAHDYPEDED